MADADAGSTVVPSVHLVKNVETGNLELPLAAAIPSWFSGLSNVPRLSASGFHFVVPHDWIVSCC